MKGNPRTIIWRSRAKVLKPPLYEHVDSEALERCLGNGITKMRHPEHQSHFTKPKSELRQERKDPNSELLFQNGDVKHFFLTTFEN
jgi:hypothetical protein